MKPPKTDPHRPFLSPRVPKVKTRGKAWMGHGAASPSLPTLPPLPPACCRGNILGEEDPDLLPSTSSHPSAAAEGGPCVGATAGSTGAMQVTGLVAPVVSRNSLGITCEAAQRDFPGAAVRGGKEVGDSTRGAASVPPRRPMALSKWQQCHSCRTLTAPRLLRP